MHTRNSINSEHNLYVLTHCESCFNKRGIFTGRIDSVLTDHGVEVAGELAEQLKNVRIDRAYTSSLKRAQQTLQHILRYHPKTKAIIDDRIIERDYGKLSGLNKNKYEKEYPDLYPVYHRSYDIPPPGGESMKDVEKRVNDFLNDLVRNMKKERINVIIVAHSNSIRPIRKRFEHLSSEEMMKLEMDRHKIYRYTVE